MKKVYLAAALLISSTFLLAQEEEFQPHGKVQGEVFGDFYRAFQTDGFESSKKQFSPLTEDENGFTLRRFYFGYEHHFSEKFSGRVLAESGDDNIADNGKRGLVIKYAYLTWKNVFEGSDLILGAQGAPLFATFSQKVWGYRSVERDIIDLQGHGRSNDLGASLKGKILSDGTLNYHVMISNGVGQKLENDKYKMYSGSVNGKFLNKMLLLEVAGDYMKKDVAINDSTGSTTTISTIKGLIGFQNDRLTVALEPYQQFVRSDHDQGEEETRFGLSVFARGSIIKGRLNAFARTDFFNPNTDVSDAGYNELFFLAGVDWTPMKGVSIIPNIWVNNYSAKGNEADVKSDVVGRITFAYKFK